MMTKYVAALLQLFIVWSLSKVSDNFLANYGIYKVIIAYLPFVLLGQHSIYTVEIAKDFSKLRLFSNICTLFISASVGCILLLSASKFFDIFEVKTWMCLGYASAVTRIMGMIVLANARIQNHMYFINAFYLLPSSLLAIGVLLGAKSVSVLIIIDGLTFLLLCIIYFIRFKYNTFITWDDIAKVYSSILQRVDILIFLLAHYGITNLYKLSMRSIMNDTEYANFTFQVSVAEGIFLACTAIGFLFFTDFISGEFKDKSLGIKRFSYEGLVALSAIFSYLVIVLFFDSISYQALSYVAFYAFVLSLFYKETMLQKTRNKVLWPSILLLIGIVLSYVLDEIIVLLCALLVYYFFISAKAKDYVLDGALYIVIVFVDNLYFVLILVLIVTIKVLRLITYRKVRNASHS
jgi:hypothetical protein